MYFLPRKAFVKAHIVYHSHSGKDEECKCGLVWMKDEVRTGILWGVMIVNDPNESIST